MLVMLYKVKKGLAPLYLRTLIPENQTIVHDLRNKRDIREPSFNTEVYKRSFFSTAIRLWNRLDKAIQEAVSIDIFKCKISTDKKEANVLFYYGKRWPAIHHARLRIGCSKLNFDVCFHLHIPNINPDCSCGEGHEDTEHFFMLCTHFTEKKN